MIIYNNDEIKFNGCPGCSYAKHEFNLPCGIAYENDNFIVSQDWELPIEGMMIVSPKNHKEKLKDFSDIERNEMFEIVNKVCNILRNNNICSNFEIIFEEKDNYHFHIWIMPRLEWMNKFDDIIANIDSILKYALNNLKNENTYKNIERITKLVKEEMKKKN